MAADPSTATTLPDLPSLPRLPRLVAGSDPSPVVERPAPGGAARPSRRPQERCRTIVLGRPLALAATIGPLRRGRGDPCLRILDRHVWRATRTPAGPATVHLHHVTTDRVEVRAWGAGADWAVDHAPELIGEHDDLGAFEQLLAATRGADAALVRRLHHHEPGLRLPRSLAVAEAMFPVVLEQRVTGQSARWSYRGLVRAFGEPAPRAPVLAEQLVLPPHPTTLAELPVWIYHRHNVEARRADTIRRVAGRAVELDAAAEHGPDRVRQRLLAINGVGPWSVAEAALAALGDPDAVSVGDYHLPHHVAHALRGVPRSDDQQLLELLEPFRGQRGRVGRLIVRGTPGAPRFAARRRHRDITRH